MNAGPVSTAELHHRAVATWVGTLASIPAGTWDQPTPCEGWSVRDLVNHVTGEELWTVPLLEGATIAEVGDRFDGDVLGEHPDAVSHDAAHAASDAVLNLLNDGLRVHLSYGEESADEYVHQLAADHLIHAWDLAAATGLDRELDPVLVAEVAAWFTDREAMYRSGGVIGERKPATGDPQGDLLAAFGRDAAWSAPVSEPA